MTENIKEITATLNSENVPELTRLAIQDFAIAVSGFSLRTLVANNKIREEFEKRQRGEVMLHKAVAGISRIVSSVGFSSVELEVGLKQVQSFDPNCFKPVDLAPKTYCLNPTKRHAASPPTRDRVATSRNVQKPKPKNRAKAK